MLTRVQKWGNSLAVRLPQAYLKELTWSQGTLVQATIVDGTLIIEAVSDSDESLEQKLEKITPQNLHTEINTGPAVGNEVW